MISTGARPCWSQAGPGSPPGRHTTWGGSVSTLLISVSCLRWADPADGLAEAGEIGRVECCEGVVYHLGVRLRGGRPQAAAAFGQFDADPSLVIVVGALFDEVALAGRRVRRDVDEAIELGGCESVLGPQPGSDRVDEVSVDEQHAPPHGDRFGFELSHPSLASSSALRGKYHPMIERRRSAS